MRLKKTFYRLEIYLIVQNSILKFMDIIGVFVVFLTDLEKRQSSKAFDIVRTLSLIARVSYLIFTSAIIIGSIIINSQLFYLMKHNYYLEFK